ncbi:MAG: TonB-dependent receptor [Bryobacter sp.]|nr:TonB-dependent receptor [Bryobacter sp.]
MSRLLPFRVVLGLFLLLLPAAAQITGDLQVKVSDPADAVISGAKVRITNTSNNASREAATSSDGVARFGLLDAGSYQVTIENSGFATAKTTVTINAGAIRELPIKLELSTTKQEVVIEESTVAVNTTSAQLSGVVEAKQVTQLALPNGVLSLAGTQPGVIPVSARNPFLGQGSFNSNGGRGRANNITIDNAQATDVSTTGGAGTGTVPLDAIREVNVITNQFSAEYGRNSSSQFQIVTKSGSNEFHGRLVHFFKNDKLNARDYFDRTGKASILRDNNWVAAIGGPIVPNKLFYFGTYEQQKIRGAGGTRTALVLTPEQLQAASPVSRQLFEAARGVTSPTGQLSSAAPLGTNSIAFSGRVDWVISSKDTLYGRYAIQDSENRSPGLTFISSNLPTNGASSTNRPQSIALSYTRTFSPTLVLNQMGTFLRSKPNFTPLENITAPSVSFQSGQAELGTWSGLPQGRTQNVYNSLTTLTWLKGSHYFKGGYTMERIQANSVFDSNLRGTVTFANIAGFQAGTPVLYSQRFGSSIRGNRVLNQGAFFQDDWRVNSKLTLNLGVRVEIAGGVSEVNNLISNLNLDQQGGLGGAGTGALGTIAQGGTVFNTNYNWAPRFGFAYSPDQKWSIRGGYGWTYDFIFLNPITNLRFAPPFMYLFSTTNFTGGDTLTNLLAGTAPFQVTGRQTVGGFGTTIRNFGAISPVDYAMNNPRVQQFSLNIERQLGNGFIARLGYNGSRGTQLQRARPINTVQPGLVVPATSAADEAARLAEFRSINAGLNAPPTVPSNRIDPRFTTVTLNESSASSTYHSMQAFLSRTFRSGFGFTAAYTWSKSIDDVSDVLGVLVSDSPSQQNPFNNRDNRAVSAFDVPHRFVFTHSYDLPKFDGGNGFVRTVLGRWNLSGIFQTQSGYPINLFGGPRSGLPDPILLGGNGAVRPNLNGALNLSLEPSRGGSASAADQKIAASGLSQPLIGNFGTLGRNVIRQNGLTQYDLTVQKEFQFRERYTVQFQSQFANLFNNTSFSRPGASLAAPGNFGYYQDTDTNSRVITLVARFIF